MERLQLPQFEDVVLQRLDLPLGAGENADTGLIHSSLKVTQLKSAGLIQLTVRGFSQADTRLCTKVFLDELVGAHTSLAKPSIDKINANMAEVTRSIATKEARKAHLAELARIRDQTKHTETFPAAVLLADTTAENDKQLQALRQHEISIREQLSPERTFSTRLFGPMFVSPRHVFPNRLIFTAIDLVLGLLVAVGWGFLSDCRKGILRYREQLLLFVGQYPSALLRKTIKSGYMRTQLSPTISKAYGIRDIVRKTIDAETTRLIGRALGSAVHAKGESAVIIGRGGRLSDPELLAALADGLRVSGVDVIDLGFVTTLMVCFGTNIELAGRRATSGVMATSSHNLPDCNGFKMVLADQAIYGEQIQALRARIEQSDFTEGSGDYVQMDIRRQYIDRIVSDVELSHPMRIAVDCGSGVAGAFAPELFRAMGCEVAGLFCEADDRFSNHHPDPTRVENLRNLVRTLQTADCELGLAFNSDGDRLGVVAKDGQIIFPDHQLMFFAQGIPSRNPGGEIIFDVKYTGKLAPFIHEHSGKATTRKTGHLLVKAKLRETGAPPAGEMSSHVLFKDHWYGFDDGLYTGARLLGTVSRLADPSAALSALPNSHYTPELQLKRAEGKSLELLGKIEASATFADAEEANRIDDVRVKCKDSFGLACPSNTTPVVVMRLKADNDAAVMRIQDEFRRVILAEKPDAQLPF